MNDQEASAGMPGTAPAATVRRATAALDRWDILLFALIGGLGGHALRLLATVDGLEGRLVTALAVGILAACASFLVTWARQAIPARLALSLGLTALLAIGTWLVIGAAPAETPDQNLGFMQNFWFFPSLPLIGYLGLVFGLVAIDEGGPRWRYPAIFRTGLNLPIQLGLGLLAGGLICGFVFLWALALSAAGWDGLKAAFEDGWLWPVLGGLMAGIAVGLARSVDKLREAAEAIILIAARLGLPLLAVFSSLFAVAILIGGIDNLRAAGSPTGILLSLAILAKLIFNAVYRDGAETPGRIMRSFAWIAIAALPVYASLAVYGISVRVLEYGFTPSRFVVLIVASLVAAYTLLLLISLAGDVLRPGKTRWMPLVSRLNTGFAALWFVLLLALQSPLLNANQISVDDQMARLMDGRTEADTFSYAALRFDMGEPGRRAITGLAEITDHPQADYIRGHAGAARDAATRWSLRSAVPTPDDPVPDALLGEMDALTSIGQEEARALLAAAIARLDAAQALMCGIEADDTLSDAQKLSAQYELQQRVPHLVSDAVRIAENFPELGDVPALRDRVDYAAYTPADWAPELSECE
ncbi:hypothetical protein [Maricaulis sp.]|uniref:hypothetical protein n=1 Tax=Maricaulis sp. TaxID=1486257 RepID=UPI003A8D1C32